MFSRFAGGFVECQESHLSRRYFQFLPWVRGLLGGSGGMLPQKILKIRYPRLAKIGMKNVTKFSHAAFIFTQKWSKKRICFTNTRLKNNNFTASRTKIDYITYHDQTFNHDITHKIH